MNSLIFRCFLSLLKGTLSKGASWSEKVKNLLIFLFTYCINIAVLYHVTKQSKTLTKTPFFLKLSRLGKRHLSFPQNCKDCMNPWQSHMCTNRPGSSVNCFRQGPCLPRQMEAEIQGVKVEEDILCQTSDGALSDFGKHSIPQFIEPSRCSSGYAVWNHQSVKHTKSVTLGS